MTAKSLVVGLVLAAAAATAWLVNADPWEDHLPREPDEMHKSPPIPISRDCRHLDWRAKPLETFWDCVTVLELDVMRDILAELMQPRWVADSGGEWPWVEDGRVARIRLGPAEWGSKQHWPLPDGSLLEVTARIGGAWCDPGTARPEGPRVEARVLPSGSPGGAVALHLMPSLPWLDGAAPGPRAAALTHGWQRAEFIFYEDLRSQIPGDAEDWRVPRTFGWAEQAERVAADLEDAGAGPPEDWQVLLQVEDPCGAGPLLTVFAPSEAVTQAQVGAAISGVRWVSGN